MQQRNDQSVSRPKFVMIDDPCNDTYVLPQINLGTILLSKGAGNLSTPAPLFRKQNMNPTGPTVVTAARSEQSIQHVEIDAYAIVSDPDLDGMLETVESIDRLEAVRKELAGRITARLLSKRAKYAFAKESGIKAEIKLNEVPRVLGSDKVLHAIAARATAESRLLLDVLLEMSDALKFTKGKLEDYFSKTDINAMCDDGTPSAPSLLVTRITDDPGPSRVESAIKTLAALARKLPKLFILSGRKAPKVESSAEPVIYRWKTGMRAIGLVDFAKLLGIV